MSNRLRYFYRIDNQGHPVPGTLQRFAAQPVHGRWKEVNEDVCCPDPFCPDCPECPPAEPEPNFSFNIAINIGDLFVHNQTTGDPNNAKFFTEDNEFLIYVEDGDTLLLQRSNATTTGSVRQYDVDNNVIPGTETVWPNTQFQYILVLAPGSRKFEIDGG